uniref:Uncharacterized protein n=1 Tax=Vespula pensylvanica TaxID=30213 RepID=A0A834UBA5_VESPE|nr:hypothetical protein H0235_007274 [Vespula pensylvanica]
MPGYCSRGYLWASLFSADTGATTASGGIDRRHHHQPPPTTTSTSPVPVPAPAPPTPTSSPSPENSHLRSTRVVTTTAIGYPSIENLFFELHHHRELFAKEKEIDMDNGIQRETNSLGIQGTSIFLPVYSGLRCCPLLSYFFEDKRELGS